MDAAPHVEEVKLPISQESQTASEFITEQLALEADAREVLPYKFDKCTSLLGPLRQNIFACLTCSPPPASAAQVYTPAGVCYACSISCHGEHNLVEIFSRRDFACDCGTSRLPSTSSCTLKADPVTGNRGVHSQEPRKGNHYNHNFQNHFCSCGQDYDAETEKGTMFQCLGLGTVESAGCGEDWFHPECLMGLPRDWHKSQNSKEDQPEHVPKQAVEGDEGPDEARIPAHPVPPGFPHEDDFEAMICYKCVQSNPWIKSYAGTPGFLAPVLRTGNAGVIAREEPTEALTTQTTVSATTTSLKRKASDSELDERPPSPSKRVRDEADSKPQAATTVVSLESTVSTSLADDPAQVTQPQPKHALLPASTPPGTFTLFLKEDFRDRLCHCPSCYPHLIPHPQLLEDEDTYEPSLSDSEASQPEQNGSHRSSKGGSIYDRGEAALSNIDRVRAIEGAMVYNQLRDKVKGFLKPFAEEGRIVSAEDIKTYFEKLRGDAQGIQAAREDARDGNDTGDNRREQSGY